MEGWVFEGDAESQAANKQASKHRQTQRNKTIFDKQFTQTSRRGSMPSKFVGSMPGKQPLDRTDASRYLHRTGRRQSISIVLPHQQAETEPVYLMDLLRNYYNAGEAGKNNVFFSDKALLARGKVR